MLEYVLKLPKKKSKTEDLVLNLAWLPHVMNDPQFQGAQQMHIDSPMILAPGKNIQNKPLFNTHDNQAQSFNIQFKCVLSLPPNWQYRDDSALFERAKPSSLEDDALDQSFHDQDGRPPRSPTRPARLTMDTEINDQKGFG